MNRAFKKAKVNSYQIGEQERITNPQDITLEPGYQIEAYIVGLDAPIGIVFTNEGDLLIGQSGAATGNANVLRFSDGVFEIIRGNFRVPLTGLNYYNGEIYVSHRGAITKIQRDGVEEELLIGLPSNGDFSNNRVTFGPDNKMYFGQGTCTNSGVVGTDNEWVIHHPLLYDSPGAYIMLNGQSFETNSLLTPSAEEVISTGAFAPYGVLNMPYEVKKGIKRASGSVIKTNPDGTQLELVAWGFRNPFQLNFDQSNRLFAVDQGYDIRGSRPIANAPDLFHYVVPGMWYGWPDYAGAEPITLSRYRPEGGPQPEFLFANHPNIPPNPFATFPPHSTLMGFRFNENPDFSNEGDAFFSEFGSLGPRTMGGRPFSGIGHRISKLNMNTGTISTFAINQSGFPAFITREGGFGRPCDIAFGPDGAMYIVDMGLSRVEDPSEFVPNTGVIWRVVRE